MEIFKHTYTAEELADVERDVNEALEDIPAEPDEYGFFKGTVTVTVEYHKDA